MATKPVTYPNIWDSAGIYATGPFIGSISKVDPGVGIAGEGHRPGSLFPTAAEHENFQQFQLTTWVRTWLARGSSAGAADAHILETDSVGRFGAVGATFVDAVNETVLDITGANTLAPTVSATCTTGANVIRANIGNSDGTGFSVDVNSGAGSGYRCSMFGSPTAARGVYVAADASSSGTCVELVQDGTGYGLSVTGSGGSSCLYVEANGSGGGMFINAAAGSGAGLRVAGSGSDVAMRITGGATTDAAEFNSSGSYCATFSGGTTYSLYANASSNGGGSFIRGSGTGNGADIYGGASAGAHGSTITARNSTGRGLRAYTHTTATSATQAAWLEGLDQAGGAEIVSANYYPVVLTPKSNTPTYSSIYARPQTITPTSPADGSLTYASSVFGEQGHWMHGCSADGAFRGVWSSLGGFGYGASYNATNSNANAAVFTVLTTATMSAGNAPKYTGTVRVTVNMRVKTSTAAANGIDVQVLDTTAGGTPVVISYIGTGAGTGTAGPGWYLQGSTTEYQTTISFEMNYTLPASGARTFSLQFKRQTAANTVTAQGSIVVTGVY